MRRAGARLLLAKSVKRKMAGTGHAAMKVVLTPDITAVVVSWLGLRARHLHFLATPKQFLFAVDRCALFSRCISAPTAINVLLPTTSISSAARVKHQCRHYHANDYGHMPFHL